MLLAMIYYLLVLVVAKLTNQKSGSENIVHAPEAAPPQNAGSAQMEMRASPRACQTDGRLERHARVTLT